MSAAAAAVFMGATSALGALLSRGPTPTVGRRRPVSTTPSPCAAVGEILGASPELSDDDAAAKAFALAFPSCGAGNTAHCAEGLIAIKGCIEALRPQIEPVQHEQLPNTCDPLAVPPAGTVCVPAGDAFVLRPEDLAPEVSFMDALEPGEVRASSDYEAVEAGSAWPIQVLDTWLEQRRQAGELYTKQGGPDPFAFGLPVYQWAALGWPGAEDLYHTVGMGGIPAPAQAAAAIRAFAETHYVLTPNGTVRIIDLPHTQAVQDFRNAIVSYVAQFQKRTF